MYNRNGEPLRAAKNRDDEEKTTLRRRDAEQIFQHLRRKGGIRIIAQQESSP